MCVLDWLRLIPIVIWLLIRIGWHKLRLFLLRMEAALWPKSE